MTNDFQASGIDVISSTLHGSRAGLAGDGRVGIANDCWGTLSTFHAETSFFFWFILYSMERTTKVQ